MSRPKFLRNPRHLCCVLRILVTWFFKRQFFWRCGGISWVATRRCGGMGWVATPTWRYSITTQFDMKFMDFWRDDNVRKHTHQRDIFQPHPWGDLYFVSIGMKRLKSQKCYNYTFIRSIFNVNKFVSGYTTQLNIINCSWLYLVLTELLFEAIIQVNISLLVSQPSHRFFASIM